MTFAIICDRCGKIISPSKNSTYTSVCCTTNEIMDTFVICVSCAGELKQWIIGEELEGDE